MRQTAHCLDLSNIHKGGAAALHFGVNICGLIAYCYQPKKPYLNLEKDLAQYA